MGRRTGRNKMSDNQHKFMVEVFWAKPGGGPLANSTKMLSLNEEVEALQFEIPWIAYSFDWIERYLFESSEQAKNFKTQVDKLYAKNPRYFVIDDEGNVVKDEDGEPIVAWEPFITISMLSDEEITERGDLEFVEKQRSA
jgi:hypothetical protein